MIIDIDVDLRELIYICARYIHMDLMVIRRHICIHTYLLAYLPTYLLTYK